MKLPNVLSTALLMALVVFLEYLAAGADQLVPALWVPVAVLLLTAAAKALHVYLEQAQAGGPVSMSADGVPQAGAVRRWLLD